MDVPVWLYSLGFLPGLLFMRFFSLPSHPRFFSLRPFYLGRVLLISMLSIITTFSFLTWMRASCLHFGQNSGKFSSIVSKRIFVRVLLPQVGHCTHLLFSNTSPPLGLT